MNKVIGHRIVIEVNGFHDAKDWIYRCIREGVVKCGQCDAPATRVFWQDRAEWYCRCNAHREYGDMWTGSTPWNPTSFSLNALAEPAKAWRETLTDEERAKVKIYRFDATDYYALMVDDWSDRMYHYFVGSATEYGWRVFAKITPLSNGEFVYELHNDYMHEHGGHCRRFGVRGVWATETEAVAAAKIEAQKRRLLSEENQS